MAAGISLILTNDWELFGEGEGDFFSLQEDRLRALTRVAEKYEAKLTVFAEVGQQFAHIRESGNHPQLARIAKAWENSITNLVSCGHDVQLHYHPTWHQANYANEKWYLNLATWALLDLPEAEIVQVLAEGKSYLEALCRPARDEYRCLVYRAGAFCIQPEEKTIPLLARVGLRADSSILPGYWDYLHIDFRSLPERVGPFEHFGLQEFPVHTYQVWDSPILRRILPAFLKTPLRYGLAYDPHFEKWKKSRERVLYKLCPNPDPLRRQRQSVRRSVKRWPSFFLRKSAIVLDYDFISPGLFVLLLEKIIRRLEKEGCTERVPIVALGHANNSHTPENLDRTLELARRKLGDRLEFSTFQAVLGQK